LRSFSFTSPLLGITMFQLQFFTYTCCQEFIALWLILTGFGLDLLTASFTISLNHI
jgi:hypothetical protein